MQYGICNKLKFTLVTNPDDTRFETETINRLFREGLDELHICKQDYDKDDTRRYIDRIDPEYHNRLVLHSYYTLVHSYNIKKIHVNHTWRKNNALRFMLDNVILMRKDIKKSTTVNNYKALYTPKPGIDELLLGPIFAKASHTINNQLIKTDSLEKALSHSKLPVIGLGGVGKDTLGFFKSVGFDGLVLQSGVWKTIDPVRSFVEFRDHDVQVERRLRRVG
jgi:thiamine-phosphate pyrophosphorylase